MNKRLLYIICGIPLAIVLFLLMTLLFTPNDAIRGVIERAADNAGYTLTFTGFGKGFPLALKARTVEVSTEKGTLVQLREARVRLEILPLLTGKVQLAYSGMIGAGGRLEGDLALGKAPAWSVQCRGVRLEDIPFFSSVAAARVRGDLRLTGKMITKGQLPEGELQLEVRGAEVAGVKVGAMPLPDAAYRQVRGALRVEKGRAELKSFTLDGEGIYVRLKGGSALSTPLANSQLDLTMEMMPKPAFLERQKFVFLLLTKYQTSPGAFSVPIRGTLGHPSI